MKFFRTLSLSLVLIVVFAQTISFSWVYLEFQIRKDFIVDQICKQRYQKINVCGGKCFIVDRFNDEQKKESEKEANDIRPVELKFFVTRANQQTIIKKKAQTPSNGFLEPLQEDQWNTEIFQPPRS